MNTKKIAIITGGSKGIGFALVKHYAHNGYMVFSIARTTTTELAAIDNVIQVAFNLSEILKLPELVTTVFKHLEGVQPEQITLINNAGALGNINRTENIDVKNIEETIALNLTSPLSFSSLFIKKTQSLSCKKLIVNISSGAAVNPIYGWSVYCSTKAGMEMFTKVIALEQQKEPYPVQILSIRPGVIDTDMQTTIRQTTATAFADVERFKELKTSGKLVSPATIAEKIYNYLQQQQFETGSAVDMRNIV